MSSLLLDFMKLMRKGPGLILPMARPVPVFTFTFQGNNYLLSLVSSGLHLDR